MKTLYDQNEVSRLTGISQSQIRYWDRLGLVPHNDEEKGKLLFGFRDLVAFRTIKKMYDSGLSTRHVRKCLGRLKEIMPEVAGQLPELGITICGKKIIIGKDDLKFTPDGQIFMDFAVDTPPSAPSSIPFDSEELFFQALECEEKGDLQEAQEKYETVLALKPDHQDALVKLGNIRHRFGLCEEAERFYRKALWIDPDHAEANYNLANILEEQGDLENAILFYRKAVHEDTEIADAFFNLGRALERVGRWKDALRQWETYLELDPASEWADYVKSRLY
ncbi:MAG: tetratricopeptide repeat protein [Deltaproteobacteria bacterium]|nr:MAG: tetratricopeptide repeat protein [Deltaproteobacteria bacterium]